MSTIEYPRTLPSVNFRRARLFRDRVRATVENPFTFQSQRIDWQGQRWAIEAELPAIRDAATAAAWQVFLAKADAAHATVLAGPPMYDGPRGNAPGTPVVDGELAAGNVITSRGWTPSTGNVLLAGDYISVGHAELARLYRVLDNVSSDSNGDANITVWPNVRNPTSDLTQANLLTDPGLEAWDDANTLTNWTKLVGPGSLDREAATIHGGTYAAKLTRDAANASCFVYQDVPLASLAADYHYRLSAWTYTATGSSARVYGETRRTGALDGADYWNALASVGILQWRNSFKYTWGGVAPTTFDAWIQHTPLVPFPRRVVTQAVRYSFGVTQASQVAYFDDLEFYGPTTDGLPIETANPVGAFRLVGGFEEDIDLYRVHGLTVQLVEAL